MNNTSSYPPFLLFSFICFLFSFESMAQSSIYGKVYYGMSDAALLTPQGFDGGGHHEVEGFREYGFLIGKNFTSKWAVETGLNVASADVFSRPIMFPPQTLASQSRLQMLSLPVLMRYSFFPFLYINAGPMLDIQTSHNRVTNQSGVGYLLGIGAQHYFNRIGFFIHPHFKRHASISFRSDPRNLSEFGVQFGMGYKF